MLSIELTDEEVRYETSRILEFIQEQTFPDHKVVVGASGGVDSDVVIRLCSRALGNKRVKCFTVLHEGIADAHISNARDLCDELGIPLVEIPLQSLPSRILRILSQEEPAFSTSSIGDLMRTRLSLRTVIFSMYNEHGYVVASTSNRTELETGLYMSFGDALGHIRPITHLYKTQVWQLARRLGTRTGVIEQAPSSGLRKGASDLRDIAHWTQKEGPDIGNVQYSDKDRIEAQQIYDLLTFRKLDLALLGIRLNANRDTIAAESGLPEYLVEKISRLVESARAFKGRPLGSSLL